jgi:hypothetical protein
VKFRFRKAAIRHRDLPTLIRAVTLLQTGQSAKSRFSELEFYEAAVGDLTLPANCCRTPLSRSRRLSDRCMGQPGTKDA